MDYVEQIATKYFTLEPALSSVPHIMYIVCQWCAGFDPDVNWTKCTEIEVSLIRSKFDLPRAIEEHNIVSDCVRVFTPKELLEDMKSQDASNPKIESIINLAKRLPIGRSSSRFYLRIEPFYEGV